MENNKYLLGMAMIVLMILAGCGTPTQEPTPIIIPTSLHTLSSAAVSTMTVEPTSPTKKTLLIYDDDGNRDGMAALLYLLINPDFSVEAINISYGEAHPEIYIQHVGRVLDDLGFQDIPLGAGQDKPLAGGEQKESPKSKRKSRSKKGVEEKTARPGLFFHEKKLGGVLCDVRGEIDRIHHMAVGIGLNVSHSENASGATRGESLYRDPALR